MEASAPCALDGAEDAGADSQLPLPRHLRADVMTYVDLLVSFIFLLLIYLVLEVKALHDLILYCLEPPQDGNVDDGHLSG
jgi:hypothetical protein